jgi:hypothetical protein
MFSLNLFGYFQILILNVYQDPQKTGLQVKTKILNSSHKNTNYFHKNNFKLLARKPPPN